MPRTLHPTRWWDWCMPEDEKKHHKTQKMCNKAIDTYTSAIQFVLDQYKTQRMCDKAAETCFFCI